jgi:hypothetical protein
VKERTMRTNQPNSPKTTRPEEIDSLRRRMVRELEQFLSKMIDRPFPRLRIKTAPVNRYTVSLN